MWKLLSIAWREEVYNENLIYMTKDRGQISK